MLALRWLKMLRLLDKDFETALIKNASMSNCALTWNKWEKMYQLHQEMEDIKIKILELNNKTNKNEKAQWMDSTATCRRQRKESMKQRM